MNDNRPPHIHPQLRCFTYRAARQYNQVLTHTVSRSVPGAVSATADGYGGVRVHQSMNTVVDTQFGGTVAHYYASFENEQVGSIEFEISETHFFATGHRIYLWLDKEFWLFQMDSMPTPHAIFDHVPTPGGIARWFPAPTTGADLSAPHTQQKIKTARYPLRAYLATIHKNTPRSFLGTDRLQGVLAKAKTDAASRYNAATWPQAPKDKRWWARCLAPVLRYQSVKAETPFFPNQVVRGQLNKRWLSAGLVMGTTASWVFGNAWAHALLQSLGINTVFMLTSLWGALLPWFAGCTVALMALLVFMVPAHKRPFVFDEEAFFKLINTPYHPNARVEFSISNVGNNAPWAGSLDLISDAELASRLLWRAHEECNFCYRSFEGLSTKLNDTKLTEEEKQQLLHEIHVLQLPF